MTKKISLGNKSRTFPRGINSKERINLTSFHHSGKATEYSGKVRDKIIVYTDGGSRGNPGPAALGVVITAPSGLFGQNSREYGEFIGHKTNNHAEYAALVFALKKVKQLVGGKKAEQTEIEVRMDSELIVKQMNAEYKIEEPDLQLLFVQVWNLKLDFKKVTFKHIPREQNRRADRMVNKALDGVLV